MTLAKGLTSGTMPLGATVVSDNIADYFQNNYLPTGLTNFAHPIGCAAALAAIDVYESERLIDNSRKMGVANPLAIAMPIIDTKNINM